MASERSYLIMLINYFRPGVTHSSHSSSVEKPLLSSHSSSVITGIFDSVTYSFILPKSPSQLLLLGLYPCNILQCWLGRNYSQLWIFRLRQYGLLLESLSLYVIKVDFTMAHREWNFWNHQNQSWVSLSKCMQGILSELKAPCIRFMIKDDNNKLVLEIWFNFFSIIAESNWHLRLITTWHLWHMQWSRNVKIIIIHVH